MPRNRLIQLRRDSSPQWAAINPVLAAGEPGYDLDSSILKIGDGATPWNALELAAATAVSGDTDQGWVGVPISSSDMIAPTVTMSGDKVQFAQPVAPNGNQRWVMARPETEGWINSEIRSLWWGPSTVGSGVVTQPGHAHRVTPTGGVIIDLDVITMGLMHNGLWAWTGSAYGGVTGDVVSGSAGANAIPLWYSVTGGNAVVICDDANVMATKFVWSDLTISGTGTGLDGTYPAANVDAYPAGVPAFGVPPQSLYISSTSLPDSGWTQILPGGLVRSDDANVRLFPQYVATKFVNGRSYAKMWRPGTPEPPWSDVSRAFRWSVSWVADLSALPALPGSGSCGLVVNHVSGSEDMLYSEVTFRPL